MSIFQYDQNIQCLKSVQIRSFLWSVFSCIRTEYGDFRKSPYSFRIQENTDQKKLHIWTLLTQCAIHLRDCKKTVAMRKLHLQFPCMFSIMINYRNIFSIFFFFFDETNKWIGSVLFSPSLNHSLNLNHLPPCGFFAVDHS